MNIGNDQETSVLEMANKILNLTQSGSKMTFHPLPEDDPLRRKPIIERAREILGWEPKVSLEQGLTRTIEWYKSLK